MSAVLTDLFRVSVNHVDPDRGNLNTISGVGVAAEGEGGVLAVILRGSSNIA